MHIQNCLLKYYDRLEHRFHLKYLELIEGSGVGALGDLRRNVHMQDAFFEFLSAISPGFLLEEARAPYRELLLHLAPAGGLDQGCALLRQEEDELHLSHWTSETATSELEKAVSEIASGEHYRRLVPFREAGQKVRAGIRAVIPEEAPVLIQGYFLSQIATVKKELKKLSGKKASFPDLNRAIYELVFNLLCLNECALKRRIEERIISQLRLAHLRLCEWQKHDISLDWLKTHEHPQELDTQIAADRTRVISHIRIAFREQETFFHHLENQISILCQELETEGPRRSVGQINLGDLLR